MIAINRNAATYASIEETGNSGMAMVVVENMVGLGAVICETTRLAPAKVEGGITVTLYLVYGTTANAAFPSASVFPEKFDE
jgi:hypothetical protein